MKTIKLTVIGTLALLVFSSRTFAGVVGQTMEVQGTNLVLSWPSKGYEYYMIQYWPDLTKPSFQLTNCVPANSTNRTTFIIPCCDLAALAGENGGESLMQNESSSSVANVSTCDNSPANNLWAMPMDGSGAPVPLAMYPAGVDTNTLLIFEAPESEMQSASLSETALSGSGSGSPMGFSNGGCDCPDIGFFSVWHIPDWDAIFTGYVFDGPTFIPVDFKDYVDRIDDITVLIDGQPTPYAEFTSEFYNGQTNWGVGIYFDRMTNGSYTIQLLSSLRTSDTFDGNTHSLVLSNLTQSITVGNTVTFTNWDEIIFGTNYTLRAQSSITNVDWEIDIYDVYNNFVDSQTGHSDDGSIEWTWDLSDYNGNPRTSDSDPFFYPHLALTPSAGGSATLRWTPPLAGQFPSQGSWLFAYMDKFYDDGTTNYAGADSYYLTAITNMEGGPLLWDIASWDFPIKFGRTYSQSERDASWDLLEWSYLRSWTIRNFYYSGHGWEGGIGGDISTLDGSNNITGDMDLRHSKAHMTSKWVKDNITFNKYSGPIPFRFVFLDGCNTATGSWPAAWGVPKQIETLDYYTSTNNVTHARPSVFVGWNVELGGSKAWGTIQKFWEFRQDWMANWSVQRGREDDKLDAVFEQARSVSEWVPYNQLWDHLKIYGYKTIKFDEYDYKGNWPQ